MMSYCRVFTAVFASAAMLSAAACISAPKETVVSKTTYTAVAQEEHRVLPANLSILTLEEAQNIAVQNNPTFKNAYFAIASARAAYYRSFSGYMPTLTAGYTFGQSVSEPLNRNAGNGSLNTSSTPSLNMSLNVFDSFQREMQLYSAKHSMLATEAAERDAHRTLLRSVAYAYNEVLLAQEKIDIALADMEYNRKMLDITTVKYEKGTSNLSDTLNFRINFNAAESSLYNAEYTYKVAKYALAQLMGLTQGDIPESIKFPGMPSPDGEVLPDIGLYLDTALQNRPDLKQYRESLEAYKYNYYNSIAAFGPTVTFNTSMNYNNTDTRINGRWGSSDRDYRTRSAGVSYGQTISWEIFSGGRTLFNMRAAKANMTQAEYALEEQWIGVVADVRAAYDNYQTNLKQVKLSQKNLEIVRKTRDLVDLEYAAGNANITRVNEAQRELVDAETALATAVINLQNAKAQLQAAINQY